VRLFLTEESFHESAGSPPSGSWATVMTRDDLQFVIAAPVPAISTCGLALLLLAVVCAGAKALAGAGEIDRRGRGLAGHRPRVPGTAQTGYPFRAKQRGNRSGPGL
jgi:hypothetical protein